MPKDTMASSSLRTASLKDRLLFISEVAAPTVAKGPLLRRPRVERLLERLGLESRAVRRMGALRNTYGDGLLLVPIPGRTHVVVLSPKDAQRILHATPDPFSPATAEKRRALSHFEPEMSLVSTGPERTERRRFHEAVLDTGQPVHSMAGAILAAVMDEAQQLVANTGPRLEWDQFLGSWDAMIRRILLGRGARDDKELTDLLARLRGRANWVLLRQRRDLLDAFRAKVEGHLARAEPGSLAHRIATVPKTSTTAPADQIAQHIFAFNTSGMAVYRALALLAAHPDALARARAEATGLDQANLPFLRAAVLESVRLWPTTPVILRQMVRDVDWGGGVLPKDANLVIYVPFFHRDDALPFAHRFAPELWLEDGAGTAIEGSVALVPFSAGSGQCPAANLVPMVGSAWLATVVSTHTPRLTDPGRLRAEKPLPGTLENTTLVFDLVST